MARVNNLTNFLNDVATAIKQKLGDNTPIPASQFDTKIGEIETGGNYQTKSISITTNGNYTQLPDTGYDAMDQVVISVNVPMGIDTSDATATAEDLIEGTTAYVNGEKIEGTLEVTDAISIDNSTNTDTSITLMNLGDIPSMVIDADINDFYGVRKIVEDGTGLEIITPQSQIANVISLTADKIKKGETILEITGTYEGSGGGSGDIKLFETEEEMQADPNPSEGDLAVIYREELTAVTEESEFDSCTFPNTVVLDEAFSGEIYGSFRAVDQSVRFDGMMEMSSTAFRFDGYGDNGEIRVEYESEDGITYTRTDGGEELQEFGTTIKWQSYGDPFNDVIGNFMQIGGKYFEGLFEYKGYKNEEYAEAYSNVRYTNNDIVFNTTDVYISDLVELIHSKEEDIKSATGMSGEITNISIVKTAENQFTMYTFYGGSSYGQRTGGFILYNNNLYACGDNYTTNIYKFTINTSNNTVVYDGEINYDTTITINTYLRYCVLLDNVSPVFLICQSGGTTYRNKREIIYTSDNIGTNIKTYDIYTPTKATMYEYKLTSTQLDAIADYVYEKTFYGKNGVESGTLGIPDNSFADTTAKVVYEIQNQYENMEPRILTDNNKTINKNIYFIPVKRDGTPLLDTSNVTNMQNMFNLCQNLVEIPLLDTSNATNMYHMFSDCTNLINIPLLDTSNVTNMQNMFSSCTNLTTIPLLDTSSATNMNYMFSSCTNLTTIPLLDTSSATDMRRMFNGCTNLTDDSLNIIMRMCTNAVKITSNKTLKYIGLTLEQVNKCKTLSNYSAFISAGWTTGY